MKKINVIALIVTILVTQGIGFLSSTLAGDIAGKYAVMNKPPLSPPGSVFGIAWGILYLLMAIAAFLVFSSFELRSKKTLPMVLFGAQLLVNFSWSIVFFRFDALWPALIIIVVLDVLVLFCIERFYHISKPAAFLMIPYLLWILFATYLNIGFAILN